MANFDRFNRVEASTWALWEYNDYQTQMNNMYWSGEAAHGYSTYLVRNSLPHIPVKDTLKSTGPNADRFPKNGKQWLTVMKDLQNWTRASFVLASTGSFERYLERVVRTALLSDPALVYGKSRAIEGTLWLKLGIDFPCDEFVTSVTKGEWKQRYAALKRLFGEIPVVEYYVNTLDEAREFRNSVGHSFGRNVGVSVLTGTRDAQKMLKIKQEKLVKWFAAFSEVAKAIDEKILVSHIGDFEPVLHFHGWLVKEKKNRLKRDEQFAKEYRKVLGGVEKHSKGKDYCMQLISFYDSVK